MIPPASGQSGFGQSAGGYVPVLTILAGLVVFMPAQAQAADCPVDRLAGQVISIEGPVILKRGGRTIPVGPRTCILYGDQLLAGDQGLVAVDTDEGPRRFGRFSMQMVWAPIAPNAVAPRSLLDNLQATFHAMFDPLRPPSVYGVSRGGQECPQLGTEGDSGITPLSRLPASDQRLGADIEVVPIGWRTTSPRRVTVQLVRTDRSIVAQAQACLGEGTDLRIPRGALRPGDRLTLSVGSGRGPAFAYPILVVSPAALPKPDGPVNQAWMVAAWRFASEADTRLDSLARLRLGARNSYAARRLLDAILTDEQPS